MLSWLLGLYTLERDSQLVVPIRFSSRAAVLVVLLLLYRRVQRSNSF
jgi:hypothetical protein